MTRGTPILGNHHLLSFADLRLKIAVRSSGAHPARQVANVTLRMGTSHGRPAIGSCVMVGFFWWGSWWSWWLGKTHYDYDIWLWINTY